MTHWLPIETGPKDNTQVLVALIRNDVVWRVSDAAFNGLGWYSKAGVSCHWRTHWAPMPKTWTEMEFLQQLYLLVNDMEQPLGDTTANTLRLRWAARLNDLLKRYIA